MDEADTEVKLEGKLQVSSETIFLIKQYKAIEIFKGQLPNQIRTLKRFLPNLRMMVRRKRTKEMEVTTVLAKDEGSFVLMRQPRRWKEVGRIKIFRQKGP